MADHLAFCVAPMTLADLDQVIEIERAAFTAPWSRQAYRFEITQNTYSTMLVVRLEATQAEVRARSPSQPGLATSTSVLGHGGFWLLVDEAHIATIAIHPSWRGQGLGELLLLSLLQQGIEQGAKRATLEVRVSNLVAQNLYIKVGFEIVAMNKRYYADNDEDAYIMATPSLESTEVQAKLQELCTEQTARLGRLATDHARLDTKTKSG